MGAPVRNGAELRKLLEWAKERGFTCEVSGSTHLIFRRPNTKSVYASYSPSCKFARLKTRRDLNRALIEAEQKSTKNL